MQDVYQEMYGQEPEVTAVHAGLECGTIVSKYPGMDAISIGPTLQDVHTPNERMLSRQRQEAERLPDRDAEADTGEMKPIASLSIRTGTAQLHLSRKMV